MQLSTLESEAKARIFAEYQKLPPDARAEISKALGDVSSHWVTALVFLVIGCVIGLCL